MGAVGLSWLALLDVLGKPLQAFEEALSSGGATKIGAGVVSGGIAEFTSTYLGWTYQDRSRIRCRPSFSVTSAGDIAKMATLIPAHSY